MAKVGVNIDIFCNDIISRAKSGDFAPVYLLMGDEPYYPDLVCSAIIDNCLQDWEKDFNETICYGSDVTAEQVITAARRFPMMAERQLVVVKEAQFLKNIDDLAVYCAEPLDSTVLVLLLQKASVDKRKALYKSVQKTGVVVDSQALRDYELPSWIQNHFRSMGVDIDPRAAALFAESTGTDLSAIAVEADKLMKNLPEGITSVGIDDVEKNVGVSRQYSVFELTRELSYRHAPQAVRIASNLGNSAKFAMPMAVSALYTHFYRILKYSALLAKGGNPSPEEKARALAGVNPYFYKEYDVAVRNYPLGKAMAVIGCLCEYDYLGKGGDGGTTAPGQLLMELVVKILNL